MILEALGKLVQSQLCLPDAHAFHRYWNRYPGIQIDIESYIYLPLLEDTGYMPSKKYAWGGEIYRYFQTLCKHYGLYKKALFQTQAHEMRWDESSLQWTVKTSRNDTLKAKWLVSAAGSFDNPKFPGIPGIETFQGRQIHSARWDYDYTGGDSEGNLHKLQDKRVGIIGTGATGIQIVPHLGKWSKELYVFQRTPSSIDARNNRPTDADWYKSQTSGWQRDRMDNFAEICSGRAVAQDLVDDSWTAALQHLTGWFGQSKTGHTVSETPEETARHMQAADYSQMERIRRRIDSIVKDPKTAEALKPYFNQFCKRPCYHDDYLPTFNRPNVTLVDTRGQGVDCITERGVVFDGKEYELDLIVYATGFEYNSDWSTRHDANIWGVDNQGLSEKWKDGPVTRHGWSVNGFPNLFMVGSAQNLGVPNYHHSLDEQAQHLVYVISKVQKEKIDRLEVTAETEKAWMDTVANVSKDRCEFLMSCTPGYYNDDGHVTQKTVRNNPYGGNPLAFLSLTKAWRDEDKLSGMSIHYGKA